MEVSDPLVLAAMETVPREEFVPAHLREAAYDDRALPIGVGQTISQPAVVAYMTEQLRLSSASRVLEIGTGSGYQAAVLAEIARDVFSIERIEKLARTAADRLARLGYDNVHVRHGDGAGGWPEESPFDAVIVSAATGAIPPALLGQVGARGGIILPLVGRTTPRIWYCSSPERHRRLRPAGFMASAIRSDALAFLPLLGSKNGYFRGSPRCKSLNCSDSIFKSACSPDLVPSAGGGNRVNCGHVPEMSDAAKGRENASQLVDRGKPSLCREQSGAPACVVPGGDQRQPAGCLGADHRSR